MGKGTKWVEFVQRVGDGSRVACFLEKGICQP